MDAHDATPPPVEARISVTHRGPYVYLMAYVGAEIVSQAVWLTPERAGVLRLYNVEVLLLWRRKGVGTALVSAALDEAREQGVQVVDLMVLATSRRAIRLYEALGFVKVGEKEVPTLYSDACRLAYVYECALAAAENPG